eukprot:CAMPEP_0174258162 /NCGR_PEP_ID=MMETSP0439-20130205/7213_1 /TAXON_ID=0 /ORGANISM="Stereomyxa ramosa, Strain Chinc5" /LENGTH=224 /DNA_ID=CAMNT_0015341569 /DNA_START=164 /DNA_END=838 /DNA_ORIENTATION=-
MKGLGHRQVMLGAPEQDDCFFLEDPRLLVDNYDALFSHPSYSSSSRGPLNEDDLLCELMALIDEQPSTQNKEEVQEDMDIEYYLNDTASPTNPTTNFFGANVPPGDQTAQRTYIKKIETNRKSHNENKNRKTTQEDQTRQDDNMGTEDLYRSLAATLPSPVKLRLEQRQAPDLLSTFNCFDPHAFLKLASSVPAPIHPPAPCDLRPVGSGLQFCKRRPRELDYF